MEERLITQIVLTIAVIGMITYYILWMIETAKRRSAERYIFIEKEGNMKAYEEFKKHF